MRDGEGADADHVAGADDVDLVSVTRRDEKLLLFRPCRNDNLVPG